MTVVRRTGRGWATGARTALAAGLIAVVSQVPMAALFSLFSLFSLIAPASASTTQPLSWREQESIGWACGGIGFEERQELKALEKRANAVLLFVAGARGTLVADLKLRIVSVSDATRGLEILADGPICVLHLPAGNWKIEARHGDAVRERTIPLRAQDTVAPQRLQFAFPEEATGSPRASPEEGSQVGDWGRVGR